MNRPSPQDMTLDKIFYFAVRRRVLDARGYHISKLTLVRGKTELHVSRWFEFNMAHYEEAWEMKTMMYGMKIVYQPLLRSYFRIVPPAHTYTLQPDGSYVVT